MRFCTAINCMDGRVQRPVNDYLRARFDAPYVDTVTEPGPNGILAERSNTDAIASIERRIGISVEHHGSVGIAVAGHHDCAGNPAGAEKQAEHTRRAVEYIRERFPGLPVIGLWVDGDWRVAEL